MSYKDTIENNCKFNSRVNWWPKYAFHYTDVTNAVGILREGILYSRYEAVRKHLMSNDNASRQVIDMTCSGAIFDVRFYFRPLTPTQYHNEGFKHPALRYCNDTNANVPVPVFFLFDLNTLLQMPETRFSEQSLAGEGGRLLNGEENFANLNFRKIYENGYMDNPELDKKYRHAEIAYANSLDITKALRYIICRNDIERATLLNLLRKEGTKIFSTYKNCVIVNNECFENNGLFVTDCRFYGDKVCIVYSKTATKDNYTRKYKENKDEKLELEAYAEFQWFHAFTPLQRKNCRYIVDYENSESTTFTNLESPQGATALYMKVFFENQLMCYMCWQLTDLTLL